MIDRNELIEVVTRQVLATLASQHTEQGLENAPQVVANGAVVGRLRVVQFRQPTLGTAHATVGAAATADIGSASDLVIDLVQRMGENRPGIGRLLAQGSRRAAACRGTRPRAR